MLSKEDFISQYQGYTDEQLHHIYSNPGDYSPEAQEAVLVVIDKKGGLEKLGFRVKNRQQIVAEINRIGNEAAKMLRSDVDPDFIRKMITSEILPPEETTTIVENAISMVESEKSDAKITTRTVLGSLLGLLLASVVGGLASAVVIRLLPDRIPLVIVVLLVIGLALLCYAIVKACTRQSNRNRLVLITTIIAAIFSVFIGVGVAAFF